ncbi:MAG: ATP-binding protein [Thiovulaceae bacterium]|nr:ATP-binding protein [Sulfurimonadaceae bacterium]
MFFYKFFNNLLNSNHMIAKDQLAYKQVRLINMILLVAIPANFAFIFINIQTSQEIFSIFNILIIFVMTFAFFLLRRSQKYLSLASHLMIFGMILIHLPALFLGGLHNSGFLWFFLFPLFAVFLTGKRAGRNWIVLLMTTTLLVYLFAPWLSLPYDPGILPFLLIALSFEIFFVFFSHRIQQDYENRLSAKNSQLKRLTENLKEEVEEQVNVIRSKDMILEQQSKMATVGEMMANISHQWKQPISTINAAVMNFQVSYELKDESIDTIIRDTIDLVIAQTDLMQTTMKDFLDFSRPNQEDMSFSLHHAVGMAVALVEASFEIAKIKLDFTPPKDSIELIGKENEFVHALMNIINNAKDAHLLNGTQEPYVSVKLNKDGDTFYTIIEDNAGGIEPDVLPKIFDPYFSTKLGHGGTGLGLYLSSRIIHENFKAKIDASNTSEGAKFLIGFDL